MDVNTDRYLVRVNGLSESCKLADFHVHRSHLNLHLDVWDETINKNAVILG